jgi:hypothetical protein
MKQFRDTDYWVDEDGNVFRYFPEWNYECYTIQRNGKPYLQKRHRPAYYKKLKPQFNKNNGYYHVVIGKTRSLHRVVAECYLGLCPVGYEVDHIDGNKINNHISNLQYLTKLDNILKSPKNWKVIF